MAHHNTHHYQHKHHHANMFIKKKATTSFLLWPLVLISSTLILSLTYCSLTTPFKPKKDHHHFYENNNVDELKLDTCYHDVYNGTWVREYKLERLLHYTNATCPSLPESKNCEKYGKEGDFLRWRWKPHGCDDMLRFDPTAFLNAVRGRGMAFVGDSVARNQMDSLLCLLSQVEIPIDVYKDADDRFRTWYFQSYNFTLSTLWTRFLVEATEREINGSSSGVFDLHLDRIDANWTSKLHQINYIIISSGHWFFRKNYLYKRNKLIGCIFCSEPNVEDLGVTFAVRTAFRTAFKFLRRCDHCEKKLLTLLRTFSPAHFENGAWNGGGYCNRSRPFREDQISLSGTYWEIRSAQVEEVERSKGSDEKGFWEKHFGVLDVTKAMLMRPDGHPGTHWNNEWMKGYSDCVHWCLPHYNNLYQRWLNKSTYSGFLKSH